MNGGFPSHPSTRQSFVGGGGGRGRGRTRTPLKTMGGTLPEEGGEFVYISLQNTQDHMLHYARHNRLHHATIDHVARPSSWTGYRLLKVTPVTPLPDFFTRVFISTVNNFFPKERVPHVTSAHK